MSDPEVYRLPPVPPGTVYTTVTPAEAERDRAAQRAHIDAAIARRQAGDVAQREAREQRAHAQAERELESFMDSAHEGYLRNGGAEAEWRAARGEIRQRHLTDLALQGDPRERAITQAMRELRASGRGFDL